jgi:hypothetical protein
MLADSSVTHRPYTGWSDSSFCRSFFVALTFMMVLRWIRLREGWDSSGDQNAYAVGEQTQYRATDGICGWRFDVRRRYI